LFFVLVRRLLEALPRPFAKYFYVVDLLRFHMRSAPPGVQRNPLLLVIPN